MSSHGKGPIGQTQQN